jgi:hypothetical protein
MPIPWVQRTASWQDADIANAFRDQATGSNHLMLGGTAVARPYALQIWGDENVGGEAVLEQASSTGWTLVSYGGGEWDVLGLMEIGVPRAKAEQLVATINNGVLPAPSARPMEVPAGDTITIATPTGRIVTNNFYRGAAYLAADRHAVVIRQAPDYDIVYDAPDSHFIVNLFLKPVKETRRAAEVAFLETLNISELDACDLTVHEMVTGLASRIYPQSPLPLSFCAGQ